MLSVFTSYFLPNQTKFCKLKADRSDFRFVFVQEKERKEKKKKKSLGICCQRRMTVT